MKLLRQLWQGWKRIAHRIGVIQTFIIMTVFYFVIIGPAALIAFVLRRDLLRARKSEPSYYREHPPFDDSLERYTHIT
jgi:hypothetical protein